MKRFLRIVVLMTLGLYVSLVVTETFHDLAPHHNESHCALCQFAHQTPALLEVGSAMGQQQTSVRTPATVIPQDYVQFVFVAHGLSPPVL